MSAPPANDICSVCLGVFKTPCQANCSHWFCGDCIMLVWRYGPAFQPCKCPLCRRQITLLVPSEASLRQRGRPEVAEILSKVETYNHYFGDHERGLIQRMQDLPFHLRRLLQELAADPQRSMSLVRMARCSLFALASVWNALLSAYGIIPQGPAGIFTALDLLCVILMVVILITPIVRLLLYRHRRRF